ncbi:MAG TPA: carboxymuconolactone decarboxylase family protein [Baekduia sp.]|nr:carboxymuconolactone decarboxylase family protein [Baekduia sp.]
MTDSHSAIDAIELLRRLALNHEPTVRLVVGARPAGAVDALDAKSAALVRLGAQLSVGAATASCRVAAEVARAAGATDQEMVAVLVTVAPVVGGARVVAAAPRLALALDHDVEALDGPVSESAP